MAGTHFSWNFTKNSDAIRPRYDQNLRRYDQKQRRYDRVSRAATASITARWARKGTWHYAAHQPHYKRVHYVSRSYDASQPGSRQLFLRYHRNYTNRANLADRSRNFSRFGLWWNSWAGRRAHEKEMNCTVATNISMTKTGFPLGVLCDLCVILFFCFYGISRKARRGRRVKSNQPPTSLLPS
jgi:hypothetical protein